MTRGPFGESAAALVYTSYEVRWFFAGEVPGPVLELFGGQSPATRTDHYLNFAPDMGVKVRGSSDPSARLELKGRQRLDGPVLLAPGVAGVAATWIKWSYTAEGAPGILLKACTGDDASVPVEKRRFLRQFQLSGGASPREVDLDESLDRGVQLELTRLRVPPAPGGTAPVSAWTIGLEAFPVSPGLEAASHRALAGPLEALANAGAVLDVEHSASYPDWLLGRVSSGPPPTN